jgi:HPt (histidine-containing phosphotransfer) domain-containing protein
MAPAPVQTPSDAPASEPADMAGTLERIGGDADLLQELIEMFLDDNRQSLEAMRGSLARSDAAAFTLQAHTLLGAAGFFGARAAADLAGQLEALGRSGDLSGAEPLVRKLDAALEVLEAALRGWQSPDLSRKTGQ